MKTTFSLLLAASAAMWSLAPVPASAQSTVQITPGQVCADNKCMRFASDLQSVQIRPRQPLSVANLNLAQNPVISIDAFRDIFFDALAQPTHSSRG